MDAPTPSTKKPTALDKVNVRRLVARIREALTPTPDRRFDQGYGSRIGDLFRFDLDDDVTRNTVKAATEGYLESIKTSGALKNFSVGGLRRQLWRDIYPDRQARKVAVSVHWRARKTKERLHVVEGVEGFTEAQIAEFGHLLHWELYGINDWLTGYVCLRKPSGYVMDLRITPLQPVNYISVSMMVGDKEAVDATSTRS